MKKVMLIGDLHLSSVSPASRLDDYAKAIFTKLDYCASLVEDIGIDACVLLGDIFHLKVWSRNPYWLTIRMMDFIKRVKAANCEVGFCIGNHDVPYGNAGLSYRQPIGVLRGITETEIILDDPSIRIVLKDHITNFTADYLNEFKGDEKFLMLAVHQCLTPSGQFFNEATVNFDEVVTEADVIAFGHIHHPGTCKKVNDIWFVNPAALSRGSISEDDVGRQPAIMLLKFEDDIKFAKIDIPVKPASSVFDLKAKAEEKIQSSEVEEFVDLLGASAVDSVSSDPVVVLSKIDAEDKLKKLARAYLDGDAVSIEAIK